MQVSSCPKLNPKLVKESTFGTWNAPSTWIEKYEKRKSSLVYFIYGTYLVLNVDHINLTAWLNVLQFSSSLEAAFDGTRIHKLTN